MESTSKGMEAANGASNHFSSRLAPGVQRFLAYAIEHSLKCGRRTAKDFIRHFSPMTIMGGLEEEAQLRANILVVATGMRMNIALKKTATSCGSDLQIALDERETDAETVVSLFDPDDRVRFLDNRALWSFLVEGQFWEVDAKDVGAHAQASAHISYLIERALEDQLLSHRDVVQGISVGLMTEYLPRTELPKIIDAALQLGEAKRPFLERDLLASIGIATLTEYIPLTAIWHRVVVPFVAEGQALVKSEDQGPSEDTLMEQGFFQRVRDAAAAQAAAGAAAPAAAAQAPGTAPVAAAQSFATTPSTGTGSVLKPMPRPGGLPLSPAKVAPRSEDRSVEIDLDDTGAAVAAARGLAAKKPLKRPGSIPPTA